MILTERRLIAMGIGAIILYWILTAAMMSIIFPDSGTFLKQVINPSPHEIWMRAVGIVVIILSNIIIRSMFIHRRKLEEKQRESDEKFRAINEAANDAIILMNNEGKVDFWNNAAEIIFKYCDHEIMGQQLHKTVVPSEYYESFEKGFEEFLLTGAGPAVGKTVELTGLRKDRTEFPLELSLSSYKIKSGWQAVGIIRDITERKQAQEKIERYAFYDPLTGLFNRRSIMSKLDEQLKHTKRYQDAFSLIMLDIDRFKNVNDNYGHLIGDDTLRIIAKVILLNIREVDIAGRYGGEEVIVILPTTSLASAEEVAERVRKTIDETDFKDSKGNRFKVTASFGVTCYKKGDGISTLLMRADNALYMAKENGRNRVEIES